MKVVSISVIAIAVLALGCAPATKNAAGIVISVDQASLTDIAASPCERRPVRC